MNALPIQLAVNLMEYWILLLLMQDVCATHIHISRRNVIVFSLISLIVTTPDALFETATSFLFSMPISIAVTVLLFSKKKLSDLLRFFPAVAIYFTLTIVPEVLLDELLPASHIEVTINEYGSTVVSLATDVILFILLLLLRYLLHKYQVTLHFRVREILGSIALFFFAFIDVALVMWVSRSHFGLAERCLYLSIFIGAFLVSTGYFLYSLFESRIRISRQTMVESEMEYLRLQLDSLQDVKENEEQIKKMRHDLASHLAVMNSLCEDGNYDEIRKYAKQLSHDAAYSGSKILTGNQIADLVVGSKMKTAEEHDIEFAFEGSLENLSNMTAPDICGLLSNAYDNAIEACLAKKHAYIRTKVSTTRNYTVIQIINSVELKVPIRSNRIATTKADKKSHGCGIEIMKQIAQKYHGSCTVSCSDTEFELKITLLK